MKSLFGLLFLLVATSCKNDTSHPNDLNHARQEFQQDFKEIDANKDHSVIFAELLSWFMGPFDHDNDGQITLAEFTQEPGGLTHEDMVTEFEFFDKNLDHVVTAAEVQTEFHKMDKDHNGALTETEYVDYFIKMFVDQSYPSFG